MNENFILIPTERIDSIQNEIKEIKFLIQDKNIKAELQKWLSKQEARGKLKVSLKTLDSYLHKGIIPHSRFAGKIYIKAEDIEAHLERNYITK